MGNSRGGISLKERERGRQEEWRKDSDGPHKDVWKGMSEKERGKKGGVHEGEMR